MTDSAKSYHRFTAYDRHGMSPHYLDWEHQPARFKHYPGIMPIALPEVSDVCRLPLIDACRNAARLEKIEIPNAAQLAQNLALACGLTAKARQPGGDFYFRSAPSAGALYPNELYLAWPESADLAAGVYHFGFDHRQLTPLRKGNFASVIQQALAGDDHDATPLFIVTGIFYRSAWKYRSRAYRYLLMDAGHLLENLRLALSANGFPARLEFEFDDQLLDNLIGVDTDREVCLGCLSIPQSGTAPAPAPETAIDPLPAAFSEASRVSEKEIPYEAILDIHNAGRELTDHSQTDLHPAEAIGLKADPWIPLADMAAKEAISSAPVMDCAEAILRRRSRRNFVNRPMTSEQFGYLLALQCLGMDAIDQNPGTNPPIVSCGCLVGAVSGVNPGFHLLDTKNRQLGQVYKGDKRLDMTAICLNQAWLANAAVHFVFMTNLAKLDQQFGARGYRYAMMTAGRLGHLLYLGATALGMGCCGIGAFYDGEARQLLGLNDDSDMLYLLAVGHINK